ncbi:MAG: ATP-binding protein [Eubacterium sp.]|nr:ATP-binding protein [Eubacterium sp.]
MHINVKNTTKILEADILLNGITVIAGYNNVGKSTILKAAYIIFRTFRNSDIRVRKIRKKSLDSYLFNWGYYNGQRALGLPSGFLLELARKMSDHLEIFSDTQKDNFYMVKKMFIESIKDYQGYSDTIEDLLKSLYESMHEIATRDGKEALKYLAEMYIQNVFNGQINSLYYNSLASINVDSDMEKYFLAIKENKITDMRFSINAYPDVFYLPAYHLLDMMEKSSFENKIHTPVSEIQSALMAQNEEPTWEEYQEMEQNTEQVKEILEEVLHGKLVKSPSGSIVFQDEVLHGSIDLVNVASGMKNLLVIQSLIEKGKLKRNGILMIDEPETNLHPQWHLKFAEVLVLLYKHMGIRIIVNSHSPYFIRALEVNMADEQLKDQGHYYLMEEAGGNLFQTRDVTDHTDQIYKLLYHPLEYL